MFNFLFNSAMATNPNTTLIPTTPSISEDTQTSETDLEEIKIKDEMNTDISKWSEKDRKKWQHMKECHDESQKVFGD